MPRRMLLIIFLILTFAGPIWVLASGQINLKADYRTANRDSSKIAPDPAATPEAILQIYMARAFFLDGLFAVHTWIAIKPANAKSYTTFQVIGYRKYRGLAPLVTKDDLPDRNWFDHKPVFLADLRGAEAEALIPKVLDAINNYPYPNQYTSWPGPNSNTFTAYILRKVPELNIAMPANAVGKDYLGGMTFFAPAVSHTGYQLSLFGLLGLTIAKQEGLEINLLGLVYGINPLQATIKLPGVGEIHLLPRSGKQTDSPLS
jgi:hypothetical protein